MVCECVFLIIYVTHHTKTISKRIICIGIKADQGACILPLRRSYARNRCWNTNLNVIHVLFLKSDRYPIGICPYFKIPRKPWMESLFQSLLTLLSDYMLTSLGKKYCRSKMPCYSHRIYLANSWSFCHSSQYEDTKLPMISINSRYIKRNLIGVHSSQWRSKSVNFYSVST